MPNNMAGGSCAKAQNKMRFECEHNIRVNYGRKRELVLDAILTYLWMGEKYR